MPKKVAIQGRLGAFHEMAAKHYFIGEEIEIVQRETFKDLMHSLKESHVDYGIMAIENSVAGSILPNYTLISESNKKIVGEIYLRIRQNLMALPGEKIENLKEVYSHPMAILQSQSFFEDYPHIRLIDGGDTASSAQEIAEKKLKKTGAIAATFAAKRYGLEILAEGIESNKVNYTRFLILKDKYDFSGISDNINKASLHFSLTNEPGSLVKVLTLFMFHNINMSKIQSMPIVGKEWEYQFYVDVEFENYQKFSISLESIEPFTGFLSILGEYEKGKNILE